MSCGPSADHWGSGHLLQIGLTSCLQSQIGGGRHLRSWGSGAGRGRRGVVRGCPLGTDHDRCEWHGSGTARGQPWYACRCWVHLDHRVRAVRGNHGCMGKPLQTARQLFPMPSGRGRMGRWLRRPASMPAELGSSRPGEQGRIYLPLFSASAIRDSIKAPILRAFRRATR